jgi:signal transduction histidine kinase
VLSLPIPLRMLLAAQSALVAPLLQVVQRMGTRHLLDRTGPEADKGHGGAVTLCSFSRWNARSPVPNVQLHRPISRHAASLLGLCMVVALSIAPAIAPAQELGNQGKTRRVVILNTGDAYLPAFIEFERGLRESIDEERDPPVALYPESLDMNRFPQALVDDEVVALLGKKYRGVKVDVVVAAGTIALEFARQHRADLWPGAAIVFFSVPVGALEALRLEPGTIGVPIRFEFGPTVDLALKLRPATRRLVVVAGTADSDRRYLALARAALERYAPRLEIRYLVDRTLAETVAAVQALPDDTVVLFLTMYRDAAGVPLVPRQVLKQLAAASNAPVFGLFDTYFGYGLVAGSTASFEAQGRRAGDLVVRILNGEDPATIGIQPPVVPGCMADWRQLRRWGIDEGALPVGCELLFEEFTVWDRYRWQILAALAVIMAQALLIGALVLNQRRLRRTQLSLQDEHGQRTRAENFAAQLRQRLARFSKERSLGTLATAIAHEVNQPLIAIQNYAHAARRRLDSGIDEKAKLSELCAKIEAQAARAGAITQRVRSLVGGDEVQLGPAPLLPLIDEALGVMKPEFESRGCRIAIESVAHLPVVLVDPLQVQLVLVNLLQNAMHSVCSGHRPGGSVSIDVRPIGEQEVQVSVLDRGSGVPPERAADIFEPLYSGAERGMGMGLAISRVIIEAHGGRLWYEPNPERGAIFRFSLRAVGP